MPMDNSGGISGPGFSLGSTIAKTVKKSPGRSIGRSVARTTKPRSSGRSSSSGGRSSGGSSGGSSNRSGRNAFIPETNRPNRPNPGSGIPGIDAYLGTDSAYQNVVRGGKRTLADFLSEMGRRRGESGTQFNQTKASMERDRVQQLESLRNEFASRGLIQSGLFGEEQGRFQQEFTQQQQVLAQQQAALLADLLGQEKNFRREQDLSLEEAKQEALQRRAAKYKIGA